MLSFFSNLFGQNNNNSNSNKVDRIAKKLIRKKKVPGIAITIIKNNEQIYSNGFGYADVKQKIAVKPDTTIFRIGSVSKPIAAMGLAALVEQNIVDLDIPIDQYLQNLPEHLSKLTLRQLGGHLSGVRNYKGNEFMNKAHLSIREGIELFKNDSLLFEPGNSYSYTSYNWNLISLIMQEASTKSFENIVQINVLDEIFMKHTYADSSQVIKNKAVFYNKPILRKFKASRQVHNYYKLASGGFLSTSEDIAAFGSALLSNKIVSNETLSEFTTSQTFGTNEKKTYYGIGFQASYDHQNRPYYGHVGNGLGGYGIFYVYPKEQLVISILMNCSNPNQDKRLNKLIDAIFELSTEKN